MSKTYYDSAFSGAQIDAAVRASSGIANIAKIENAGKIVCISDDGSVAAVSINDIIENADNEEF